MADDLDFDSDEHEAITTGSLSSSSTRLSRQSKRSTNSTQRSPGRHRHSNDPTTVASSSSSSPMSSAVSSTRSSVVSSAPDLEEPTSVVSSAAELDPSPSAVSTTPTTTQPFAWPRTKSARLKVYSVDETRKVHFATTTTMTRPSLDSSRSTQASSVSTRASNTTTTTTSRSSKPSPATTASGLASVYSTASTVKASPKRRRTGRQPLWLEDNDDKVEAVPKKAAKTTATTFSHSAPAPRRRLRVTGGGQYVYDVADSGHVHLLRDEVAFLASSLTLRHGHEAAVDLADLLSQPKNRQVVVGDASSLATLLDVLRLEEKDDPSRLASPVRPQQHRQLFNDGPSPEWLGQQAHLALWHFLSLDCTLSSHAATSPSQARQLRLTVLSTPSVLAGLLERVVHDPVTDALRGTTTTAHAVVDGLPSQVEAVPGSPSTLASSSPGTPGSQDTHESLDPTRAGRQRRRNKRLETAGALSTIPENGKPLAGQEEEEAEDGLSYASMPKNDETDAASTDSHRQKTQMKMDGIVLSVVKSSLPVATTEHACGIATNDLMDTIPLLALNRIITGKMEGAEEESCLDQQVDDEGNADDDDGEEHNPILVTNRLLNESGAIPFLSKVLGETMVAAATLLRRKRKEPCEGCLTHLHKRVQALVSIVDGACLLSEANRQRFCEEGYTQELGGCLVVGLVTVLDKMMKGDKLFEGVWGEITFETLRTLTSLTHENEVAAEDLQAPLSKVRGPISVNSLEVLANVLCTASAPLASHSNDKLKYDSAIFCLNILANAVESGVAPQVFADMKAPGGGSGGDDGFVQWLVRWAVEQTESFKEALAETTFGSSPSKHSARRLEASEDEKLVLAGNAFVLLTCLLVATNGASGNLLRDIVLAHVPGSGDRERIGFIMNALKAFCNFYHYSVGDLSVAVVAPVKQLIGKLEAMV